MTRRRRQDSNIPECLPPAATTAPPSTLAGRINRLFEVHHPPQAPQREYRNSEVVARCKEAGRELSDTALSELRRGIKRNPSMRVLQTLAWFFQVSPGYFLDDDTAVAVEQQLQERKARLRQAAERDREAREDERQAALQLQRAIRDSGVTKMAHRGLSSRRSPAERARMMRQLAAFLLEDDDEEA